MVLFEERSAMCAAPTVRAFVANLLQNLTRTWVPPSFVKTLRRKVWLLNVGVDCTEPFTVVDRNDAAQLSTHVASNVALLTLSSVATYVLPFVVSIFLQALKKVKDSATIIRVLIPEEVNFFMVFILWIIICESRGIKVISFFRSQIAHIP
jgi:hypothetical protein